jgi:hydrogenase nickel incorporation protein HypB
MERKVLSENDRIAADLRAGFRQHGILTLNLISSPGSGKTSLLERTLERFASDQRVAVLTGDIQTDNDAQRLARAGFPVKQISTGGACHLDAKMVDRALQDWSLSDIDLLLIENVGNLICPTSFDLGEAAKIVVVSVTEGDDKPLKYPSIFLKADLAVLNKIDLLPHLPCDIAELRKNTLHVNPEIEVLEVSCLTGAGLDSWTEWLAARRQSATIA